MLKTVIATLLFSSSYCFASDMSLALDKAKEACLDKNTNIGICNDIRTVNKNATDLGNQKVTQLNDSGNIGKAIIAAATVAKALSDRSILLSETIGKSTSGSLKVTDCSVEVNFKFSF